MYRDRIVSRTRDLVRNDGWASGAITRTVDNCVGASFRAIAKPDYRALRYYSGLTTFDEVWAREYSRQLDSHYRSWANDPNRYCDVTRNMTIPQIMGLAFRHKLIDGDSLAIVQWRPDRIGEGRARYATTIQLIDPDRLSNPNYTFDLRNLRGGVEIDHDGQAIAYHIRRAHQGDWYNAADSLTWDRVPRETEWGRPIVIHDYECARAGQHRGGAGVLSPVLERLRMLAKYDGTELDAAIINAIFGAYVKSPFDPEIVGSALQGSDEIGAYQESRAGYHKEKNILLEGARIPHLFPGESIEVLKSERANAAFASFQSAMLRNAAAALGLSYEQISQDWSTSNYSSARGAIIEAWKTLTRRRIEFSTGFADPLYSCFVEESFDVDGLPLPAGAPEFNECRMAYSECKWLAPGRGNVDALKERQGSMLGIYAGLTTLEIEAAENSGLDLDEVLDQRAEEIQMFKDRGLEPPSWSQPPDQTVEAEKVG